jgi:hypothetical protein
MRWELQIADAKSGFVAVAVIASRDLVMVGCNVVASMFMIPIHAAHPVSDGGERRRSSAAVKCSIKRIVPPHAGQRQVLE